MKTTTWPDGRPVTSEADEKLAMRAWVNKWADDHRNETKERLDKAVEALRDAVRFR